MSTYRYKIDGTDVCEMSVESAELVLRAGGPDELTLDYARDYDGAAPHEWNDTVTVTRETLDDDGAVTATITEFLGRVTSPTVRATRPNEGFRVRAVSAWEDLKQVTLEQTRKQWNPTTETVEDVTVPTYILGIDSDGSTQTTGQVLADIVAYCAAQGGNISAGTILSGREVPPTEVENQSCDQALRNYLRHHPDAVAWLDGATMQIQASADLSTISLPEDDEQISIDSVKRDDLAPQGVKILWKASDEVDGDTRVRWIEDSAGSSSGWPPVQPLVIPLQGANVTYQKSEIETRTLPTPSTLTEASTKNWVKGLYPILESANNSELVLANWTIEFVDPHVDGYDEDTDQTSNPNSEPITQPATTDDFPRQLVRGTIEPWMAPLEQHEARITADLHYLGSEDEIAEFVGTPGKIEETVTITDALSRTYTQMENYDAGAQPISGLAQDYFDAVSAPQYEGTISGVLTSDYIDVQPGVKVHETTLIPTAAAVKETSINLIRQTFSARYGPTEFRNPRDVADLRAAIARNRPRWTSPEEMTEARTSAGQSSIALGSAKDRARQSSRQRPRPNELWEILVSDPDTGTIKLANPGQVKRTSAMDNSGLVSIADVGVSFIPSAGEFLVLKVDPDLTTTLTVESQWTGWPMPVESEESTPSGLYVVKFYRYVLWEFVATPASGHRTVKITDSVSAVKRCPSANLQFRLTREEDSAGHVVSAYTLHPAPGCQESSA